MNLLEGYLEESVGVSPIIDEVIMKLRTIGEGGSGQKAVGRKKRGDIL